MSSVPIAAAEKVLKTVVSTENDKKDSKIVPKDFYWDQIMFYVVTIILGLSFVDISVEFFRGSEVKCFTPTDIPIDRDHFSFLNNYCYNSLPHSQFYLVFLLVAALGIIAPHYLWTAYFDKHFDYYFDLLKKLDRLHDPNTGEYNPLNFVYIKKLEEKFSISKKIYLYYIAKLILQLSLCIAALIVNNTIFKSDDFETDFNCVIDLNSTVWPYRMDIPCVYNTLRLLLFLRWAAFFLLLFCCLVLLYGIMAIIGRHTAQLGAKYIARFCYHSFLQPEHHQFPGFFECFSKRSSWDDVKNNLFNPIIKNDLDFLLLKLYVADSGHGQVFKDIQVIKELNDMIEHDHERLHLLHRISFDIVTNKIQNNGKGLYRYNDSRKFYFESGLKISKEESSDYRVYTELEPQLGLKERDWNTGISPMRSYIYGFMKFVKRNDVAVDITFENKHGYSLVLAKAFGMVTTVFYDRHFRNKALNEKYQTGNDIIIYPDNIYSQVADDIVEADKCLSNILNESKKKVNVIIVGSITDRSKLVSTNLLVNKLYEYDRLADEATLIAVRPLRIGTRSVLNQFQQYIPPEGVFEKDGTVLNFLLKEKAAVYAVRKVHSVKKCCLKCFTDKVEFKRVYDQSSIDQFGVKIMCEHVSCIFEIYVYKYKGKTTAQTTRTSQQTIPDNAIHSV